MNSRKARKYVRLILVFILGYLLALNVHGGQRVETRIFDGGNSGGRNHVSLERSIDMDLFWDVWGIINQDYVYTEQIEEEQDRVEGAIQGMLDSLDDPYTLFMDADEAAAFEQSLHGELQGIGAEVSKKNGLITVVSPLKNTPAAKAGIMPGDIIISIDGESTQYMSLHEAVMLIRGELGTKVLLEISRRGEAEFLKIEVTRDEIRFDSVTWKILEGGVAYIEIIQFDDNTFKNLNSVINQLLLENANGIILDLRNNSGGYLDVSVDVLSEFASGRKKAVLMKSRNKENNKILYTSGRARLDDFPLVVLINGGSASASEIVAGAVHDWRRGVLIGEKSFGKGSVQELRSLDGGAQLRITVAKWNTPNDVNIDKEGIEPDIKVEKTTDDHNNDRDPQLDCALEYLDKGSCSQEVKGS